MPQFLGVIEAETPKAILFRDHFWSEALWLPKSQCTILDRSDGEVLIQVTEWLARKNNLSEAL